MMISMKSALTAEETGFTLLEVMFAMLLFAVVMAGMTPVFGAHVKRNTDSEIRLAAMSAAQQVLDEIRLEDPTTLPATGAQSPITLTVDGKDFQVTATFCADATYCTTTNNRHITVEVAFRGNNVFSTETVYTQLR